MHDYDLLHYFQKERMEGEIRKKKRMKDIMKEAGKNERNEEREKQRK